MNITAFFVDALGSALELGVATPDDVLKHATPDVLAAHLPRPLWAKLLTACLAAPRVDARLVVETIGVPALCEHVPGSIVWGCLLEVGQRALGKSIVAPPPARADSIVASATGAAKATDTPSRGVPVLAATPGAPASAGGSDGVVAASAASTGTGSTPSAPRTSTLRMGSTTSRTETPPAGVPIASRAPASGPIAAPTAAVAADEPAPLGAPPLARGSSTGPTGPSTSAAIRPASEPLRPGSEPLRPGSEPLRPGSEPLRSGSAPSSAVRSTGAGASTRRPQAQAPAASTRPGSRTTPPPVTRRPTTASTDFDIDTDMSSDWKKVDAVAVDDDQLVDWAQSDETSTSGPDVRKR